jgi:hypothetical protein
MCDLPRREKLTCMRREQMRVIISLKNGMHAMRAGCKFVLGIIKVDCAEFVSYPCWSVSRLDKSCKMAFSSWC